MRKIIPRQELLLIIVYNELLIRGYSVDVGIVEVYAKNDEGKTTRKQFEVDFVVNQSSQRYYIQVTYDMTSEEKQTQELNSFRNIPNSFKKIVIVNGTKKPWRTEEGFVIMGMKYFLLNADSLEFQENQKQPEFVLTNLYSR